MAIVLGRRERRHVIAAHVCLILAILVVAFPFLMVFSISFRPGNFAGGHLIPESLSLEHWKLALGMSYVDTDGQLIHPRFPVLTWIWNSFKVGLITATIVLLVSFTSAYAFSRMRFRWRVPLLKALLLLQMFPAYLALVAIYSIFDRVGELVPWLGLNSHWSLALANVGTVAALHIWLIKGYFDSVPREMEESAAVDGATPFQALVHILLPLALPVLVVVFTLAFLNTVVDYPIASVLLHEEDQLTLAAGSRSFFFDQNSLWGDFAATAILAGLPLTLLFLVTQRWLVSGLTSGGVRE